jgi:hypothetical protein
MELIGGFTIMLILLGLCAAAALLSLPILVWGLQRRVEQSLVTLELLEERTARIEQYMTYHHPPAIQPAGLLETESGGE